MIKKYCIWQKVEKYMYKRIECNDESMKTLGFFLNDGIGFKSYIEFLNDKAVHEITGNISYLIKQGNMVTIEIDDYVYPHTPLFTTTVDNLITILKEFRRLENLEVNRIEISLDNDAVTISGD